MSKLIGQSVLYQYVVKQDMTIHSEDKSELSMPIRIDALFDENPKVDTLKRMGWVIEKNQQKPIIINLPYNTPKLTVNARITVESVSGVGRPRVFKITSIQSDIEYPDAFTCVLAPVFDQYVQKNSYTLVNHEKLNEEESDRTSKDQPYKYITDDHSIDNTPEKYTEWNKQYNSYINEQQSPYSG